jgi:hypothetical protein
MSYLQKLKELENADSGLASANPDFTEGQIKAVRTQRTEWRNLKIDETTTGVLICSRVLEADIWLALRDDFQPDPELSSFAVFYCDEIPFLRNKTPEQLQEIHRWKLTFPGCRVRH